MFFSVTNKTCVPDIKYPFHNCDVFGTSCTEVELDVLTGNYIIHRMDVLYDSGVRYVPVI